MHKTVADQLHESLSGAQIFGIVYAVLVVVGVIADACLCFLTKSEWIFAFESVPVDKSGQLYLCQRQFFFL